MIGTDSAAFASLAMYPFDPLKKAWEALYSAAAGHIPGAPPTLRWDLDPHDTWLQPQLAVGMTCGWPLVTALREGVRPVGAFAYLLDGNVSHLYRSVIIARTDRADDAADIAALNSADSLSGYISLLAATDADPHERTATGSAVWTGSHTASIDAVRTGAAGIASIDGLTWAYLEHDAPQLLDGLTIVGRGPLVPSLPVILGSTSTDDDVSSWRQAISRAVADPMLAAACETLLISGFVPLDLADYDTALAGLLARFGTT